MKKELKLKDNEVARMYDLAQYAKKIGLDIYDFGYDELEPLQIQIENLLLEGIKELKNKGYDSI